MHLVAAGLSFRSAPVCVRERAVVAHAEASTLLRYLVGHCGLSGAAVLSTCNRTEFYVSCPSEQVVDEVRDRLALYLDPEGDGAVAGHLFAMSGSEAVRHILRVAGGLESMVVGEAQVLGQLRDAHHTARQAKTLDASLDYVLRRAISAGKRVRTETSLGRHAGSLAEAAADVATELAGDLRGSRVLLLGAGTMGTLAGRRLAGTGARLLVASQGGASATALAASLPDAVAVGDVVRHAAEIEVVVAATNSDAAVLTAAEVAAIQAVRDHRRLVIVDISVPRDVEATAAAVDGVVLVDVDAVGSRVAAAAGDHRAALAEATALIEAEVVHTIAAVGVRNATGPTIAELTRRAEALRSREVERTLARHPVDAVTAERIQQLSRSLVAKLLHAPIAHLREHADDPAVALSIRDAFDLDATEPRAASSESSAAAS